MVLAALVVCLAFVSACGGPRNAGDTRPARKAIIKTSMGDIVCELYPDKAPMTVDVITGLADGSREFTDPNTGEKKSGTPYYDGIIFHRVIPEFMIQTGDPLGTGRGGPGFAFDDEFHPDLKFDRPGRLAMANAGPGTNGSQIFITVAPTPNLDGRHTIFGQVIEGQEVAVAISQVARDGADKPRQEVRIRRMDIIRE
ncbi:MAG: peptidylprolyl isomerase [candidate division Zixibacteria bacterium]|nr:peptidylprolyl isomerase [candidate division Zixibacteria bacterium]